MKDRKAWYLKPDEKQEKVLKFRNGDKREDISCLDKKYFDKKNDKDKIVGYVHLKNKGYTGREYGTLLDASADSIDVYSKKKFYQYIVGYINTNEEEYVAVTRNMLPIWLLSALAVAVIIFLILIGFFDGNEVKPPDFSEVVTEEDDEYDITAKVILPDGKTTFDGTVYTPEVEKKRQKDQKSEDDEPYTGEGSIKVTLVLDGKEHTLVDTTKVTITKGQLPDVTIDFTKLDFELKPGVYIGCVYIVYADGSKVKKPIKIVIYDSSEGSAGIGFSNQVTVDKSKGSISLKYESDNTTTSTIVQIIALKGEKEVLLGQSEVVNSGDTVKKIKLNTSAKSKIKAGSYEGYMRIYFNDTGINESTNLKTDIECRITVK